MIRAAILMICFILITTGCNSVAKQGSESPLSSDQPETQPLTTPSETLSPEITAPPDVDPSAQLIQSYAVGESDKWSFYVQKKDAENEVIIWHSSDKGQTWEESTLPAKESWEKEMNKETLFVSLHSKEEAIPSWLLITSDPAMGLMGKMIYQSEDNGTTWAFKGDLTQVISGSYITGISFRDDRVGWITGTYHGGPAIPLYRTDDNGLTWNVQEIDVPSQYDYGNVYPPKFDTANKQIGILPIEFTGGERRDKVEYKTTDGGETWTTGTE